ncbi:YrdB family protein [Spirosoma aerolatum]|uniref:YrdB family protein n=1 Tax=Spirosoma aerolatum TaxID=1211326 RepID=UPI0009AC5818|nr:YrdB family protein [Spirosoma aerolatum]
MQLLKGLHQTLYFLLELCMLGAYGYAGFHLSQHPYGKYLLAIGLPLAAATMWGIFAAPRSAHQLGFPYHTLFVLLMFGLAFFLLYRTGYTQLAIILGALALVAESTALALR